MKAGCIVALMGLIPMSLLAAEGESLEKRVEALEFASYANTITWNGFFESRFDLVTKKPDGGEEEETRLHRWLLGLDFKASPSDNLQFFGRIIASTIYNPTLEPGFVKPSSITGGRGYQGSELHVERAFFNYTPFKNLTLTVGRLPTVDGPPTHLYDGLSRLGSYPKIIYSAILDGYGITYNLGITDTQNLAIRYVYSPFAGTVPSIDGAGKVSYPVPPVAQTNDTVKNHDVVDISGAMLDYTATGTGIARNVNLILQYLQFKDFKVSINKWDYIRYAFYFELEDLAKTGVNLYGATLTTINKTESGLFLDPTSGQPAAISFLANGKDQEVKGQGLLLGLGYRIPFATLKDPLIGLETISTDKGFLVFDTTAKEPFEFYGVRGKGQHAYLTFALTDALKLRIGQVSTTPEYAPGLVVGEPTKISDKNSSFYANFRLDY